ncbi:protein TIFY 4B-like isoform X2 [Olea europaea var. sylvestris]|uniref:Protein TIFY n=1 Tax=Olea europaea subsp. europaea TaxID=158383 RepID=A0A8S0R6Z1_OLEEU|nr:protein TIFY 4B-like isoform X2 [Olea europaea var. sylvestris]CAA2974744.1 TIFY 4B-like isoform X1 [Olea europaea subsp. europaea]
MQESVAMLPEDTIPKSPLDKPLQQLTEDDISQITREDCRRYLKEKGMRRPSWNKSQAIQQVIMLKRLLETTSSDTEAEPLKKLYIPRLTNANNEYDDNPQRVSEGTLESAEEKLPFLRKDPGKKDSSGDLSGSLVAVNNESAPSRTVGSTNIPAGQMTIFYCGKVNVYDDVPADKVRAIMHFAASLHQFPQEPPFDSTAPVQPSPCHSQSISGNLCPDSATVLSPALQTAKMGDNSRLHGEESNVLHEDCPAEGPSTRKASVQRYLEKRKDRFKSKRKIGMASCAGLDIYVNHQIPNEHSRRSDACSPPQIRPPSTPTWCRLNVLEKMN